MLLINKSVIKLDSSSVEDIQEIPVGNWMLKESLPFCTLHLMDEFKLPKKIYGDCEIMSERYMTKFIHSQDNLGILLIGLKGTGKTIQAKHLCAISNLPVLFVSTPINTSILIDTMSRIKQEVIVLFDEFEKVYKEQESQERLLNLFDGTLDSNKKMFIFTSNELSKYNNYLLNRPGRIHYLKQYRRVEGNIVRDMGSDLLTNKTHVDQLVDVMNLIKESSIDMVRALCEECNLFEELPAKAISYLNINADDNSEFSCKYTDPVTGVKYALTLDFKNLLYSSSDYIKITGKCLISRSEVNIKVKTGSIKTDLTKEELDDNYYTEVDSIVWKYDEVFISNEEIKRERLENGIKLTFNKDSAYFPGQVLEFTQNFGKEKDLNLNLVM